MAKNIIVLMDGTWDKLSVPTSNNSTLSNIAKLDRLLLQNTQQLVYYDDGVGADAIGLSKLFDGATGFGLFDKIIAGYQFIMQNYNINDRVFILGFSRGAYTARYIADFIAHMGLLKQIPQATKEEQFQRVNAYFNQYMLTRNTNNSIINPAIANAITIQMLGVFDTVGELGVPLEFLATLNKELYEFHDNILHNNVINAYQALAIDEKRVDYKPCLWQPRNNITQVWFSGSHCDIGGGYSDCGLADITLKWMLDILHEKEALLIDENITKSIKPNPYDILHDSAKVFPFDILATSPRIIPDNSLINSSTRDRINNLSMNYKPINIPANVIWV